MMIFTALYSFFITFSQYWLKWWTEADSKCTPFYMGGYMILALAAWISTNGTMWYASSIDISLGLLRPWYSG
jgi:hypothetical protein